MNYTNIKPNKQKYFYTVLFLNNYFPKKAEQENKSVLKVIELTDVDCANFKWESTLESGIKNKLIVHHHLPLPLTLEMWDNNGNPIFYCPLLKEDIDSLTIRKNFY